MGSSEAINFTNSLLKLQYVTKSLWPTNQLYMVLKKSKYRTSQVAVTCTYKVIDLTKMLIFESAKTSYLFSTTHFMNPS